MAKKFAIVHTSGLVLHLVDNVEETDEGLLLTEEVNESENEEENSVKHSLIQNSSKHLVKVVQIKKELTEEEKHKFLHNALYW